ncbi:thioesterase II family protein [Teredinibacter turnerae]|uniref:Thioesterase domain protein n=1 Tax=Teredinibacter turnerae (strain ATCC 39867 / T7901) TaxID=377629 RepID=C5BN75_TERTT|nr:alpha/beta fold hydrolase [Teredinibacter turnerae]ACR14139.1 thioesterase domain protein [Teredinibacter turnerae T7901]
MTSKWFIISQPKRAPAIRLICFPYAGGSAAIYFPWLAYLPEYVELVAVQLPGRANRINETPFVRMEALIESLFAEIVPLLDRPYVIFGHSLGSRMGIELIRKLSLEGKRLPSHFIASGSRAPHIPIQGGGLHDLPMDEFIGALRDLNGTPEEILKNDHLMRLCAPTIRADFCLGAHYVYKNEEQLPVRTTVFAGRSDVGLSDEQLVAWGQHFETGASVKMFDGDHFFLESNVSSVLEVINGILISMMEPQAEW